MELKVVYSSLEKISQFVEEEDIVSLKDCVGFIGRSQNGFTIKDLKKLPVYVLVSNQVRGKYKVYLDEFEEKIKSFVNDNFEVTREKLNDDSWNPDKEEYTFKVTDTMVKQRIFSSPEYKSLCSGKKQLEFAHETIKSITKAMDTLQFLPPEVFDSRLMKKPKTGKGSKNGGSS